MANYVNIREDFGIVLADGRMPGNAINIHKFGRNDAVSTTFAPVAVGGVYRTPQVGSATKLRIKAGNANDTAAGSGARSVLIEGLKEDGKAVTEVLATAGTSASAVSQYTYIRLYRAIVYESGSYASQSTGSHAAAIVIENAAGTQDWLTIGLDSFPRSQSEVAAYTVPKGKKAFLQNIFYVADDKSKIVELVLFQRQNILETAAPYTPMRVVFSISNTGNFADRHFDTPLGPFPELTDLGCMAKIDSGTTEVHVDFELVIVDSDYNPG